MTIKPDDVNLVLWNSPIFGSVYAYACTWIRIFGYINFWHLIRVIQVTINENIPLFNV